MPPNFYVNCVKYTFFFLVGGTYKIYCGISLKLSVVCQAKKLETKTQLGQMS